jgi:hypothetical protein
MAAYGDRPDQAAEEKLNRLTLERALRPTPTRRGADGRQFVRQQDNFGVTPAQEPPCLKIFLFRLPEQSLLFEERALGVCATLGPGRSLPLKFAREAGEFLKPCLPHSEGLFSGITAFDPALKVLHGSLNSRAPGVEALGNCNAPGSQNPVQRQVNSSCGES